jgi:SAM-dependent methyltransferase
MADARERFLTLLRAAVASGDLVKLTLGRYRGPDSTLRNLFVRPVQLKRGPHLTFLWRHATRDVTKNHVPKEAIEALAALIGGDFLDAHLFTSDQTAQLECPPGGPARLKLIAGRRPAPAGAPHDQPKSHLIAADAPWLQALGVTNARGQPQESMSGKFRQIQKFAELLQHLLAETSLADPIEVVDMGCGKGYLTFAVSALLGPGAHIRGVEERPELVELCRRVAAENGFAPQLEFSAGAIADTPLENLDVLIALHACDTATDDALAKGIAAGATLLVVAPCCQKELRTQLTSPPVLADPLRHGIFQERQAEFVTDALRAELLEWAGYRTRVVEFISTEHTAKNLMISAVKAHPRGDPARAARIRAFASFYGIRRHALARQLGFLLG